MKQKFYDLLHCFGVLFFTLSAVHAQLIVKNSSNDEVMRITQDKKVAIGTTAPSGKMSIAAVGGENFVLFCTGSKSYFDIPVLIGKTTLSSSEDDAEVLIYQNTAIKAANLILKGKGDDQRYSQIQLGQTDSEKKWLINYHNSGSYQENLTFTYHNGTPGSYPRHLTITSTGFVGINMDEAMAQRGIALTSPLQVDLPIAANNQDAINKGLTYGAFYRTNTGEVRVVY